MKNKIINTKMAKQKKYQNFINAKYELMMLQSKYFHHKNSSKEYSKLQNKDELKIQLKKEIHFNQEKENQTPLIFEKKIYKQQNQQKKNCLTFKNESEFKIISQTIKEISLERDYAIKREFSQKILLFFEEQKQFNCDQKYLTSLNNIVQQNQSTQAQKITNNKQNINKKSFQSFQNISNGLQQKNISPPQQKNNKHQQQSIGIKTRNPKYELPLIQKKLKRSITQIKYLSKNIVQFNISKYRRSVTQTKYMRNNLDKCKQGSIRKMELIKGSMRKMPPLLKAAMFKKKNALKLSSNNKHFKQISNIEYKMEEIGNKFSSPVMTIQSSYKRLKFLPSILPNTIIIV